MRSVVLSVDQLAWQPVFINAVATAQRNRGGGPVTSAEVLKVRPDLARNSHDFNERAKRLLAAPPLADGRMLVLHSVTKQGAALWCAMVVPQ
jgi:hypothetical protein